MTAARATATARMQATMKTVLAFMLLSFVLKMVATTRLLKTSPPPSPMTASLGAGRRLGKLDQRRGLLLSVAVPLTPCDLRKLSLDPSFDGLLNHPAI